MNSAFAISLHMHQPIIPAGPDGAPISNLQHMWNNFSIGDNHNAPVFLRCYERMGDFVPQLVGQGASPRVMLDFSGNLFWGLEQMKCAESLEKLRTLAHHYPLEVEWLGTAWGHAVAPSTPPADYRLHVRAWKENFRHLFGDEALSRVKGFSPSEMALPNHPDIAYEFVKTLREEGFVWVIVQEHTVELEDGSSLRERYLPHRLVCRNTKGETAAIMAIIKTQGSDTKLVAQMQPYFEALSLSPAKLGTLRVPPISAQIADGENGGVMMNEFPSKYMEVVRTLGHNDGPTRFMNGTEYLGTLREMGVQAEMLPACQPIHQAAFFREYKGDASAAIEACKRADYRFHMDGGTWTNNISWVKGYEGLLGDMENASVAFHKKYGEALPSNPLENADLFNLLCAQTSCFRYWGEGIWPEWGKEFCRRVAK